ncbi:phosphoribosylformylglycinamidine synthase isoform X2 [Periplaneta americana]
MTQCRYNKPIESFELGITPEEWYEVDVLSDGRKALEKVNSHLGLAFDDWDLDFYTDLFKNKLKRNPTSVECFDLAQSNSEHSRHWFFKGRMVINGKEQTESLIDMIINTQNYTNPNNVIKFSDNSSAMEGFEVKHLRPTDSKEASSFKTVQSKSHLIFTAETHNFPTGVAPFSGATTGTGGRIRDVHAVGRGGHCIAGTAGYCVGNLLMPDYELPWEDPCVQYPDNFAPPLEVLIEASNGASDYGNKFGEPVISGFARSFGMLEPSGDRREWIKPIMFSGGIGSLDANMINKLKPEKGMKVVKLGGPVYRIGVGGGSASSVEVQGDNKSELDFGAVQRGDAEMEQKLNRVIRACLERGSENPICSIHDQGAGGNGNVLKELVEPSGAIIFTNKFQLGDPTISTLELWGAEYQENDAMLCHATDVPLLQQIGDRERCPINFVGTVLDSGKVILSEEEEMDEKKYLSGSYAQENVRHPVDLELELVLGKMPQKVFNLDRKPAIVKSLSLPADLTVKLALERVLRLPSVASKRYLTNKVDRCVTGLIAQQQCVGPLHTPLADVAVTALTHFSPEGIASAIGEQPVKGLVDAPAGARMAVAESLTNLVFARVSDIKDIKCSGNWMWAAKLPGEGAALYDACTAMCKVMTQLGIAVDGGKDSLSMAARVDGDTVKAPGALVISTYAPCPNIKQVVTPDLKGPARGQNGTLLLVDLSGGKNRIGGTALAQCFKQLGDDVPDLDEPTLLKQAFIATQKLIRASKVIAGHDISDGGIITCLLEMAFAGISGIKINITHKEGKALDILFAEELGWVLEVDAKDIDFINTTFKAHNVPVYTIGQSTTLGIQSLVTISVNDTLILNSELLSLFRTWEETSYRLERRQANPDCVRREFESLGNRKPPSYRLTFDPHKPPTPPKQLSSAPRVAVIREEGSNGDREMAASLFSVGFDVWDVTMQDLLNKQVTADNFQGIIFPGGFSYADVLGSAKGWAASLLFHPSLRDQFRAFVERKDTFSLGVCNGCQLISLLGWIGLQSEAKTEVSDDLPVPDVVLDHNLSERFECRFSTVRIERSPSIMLRGMEGCVLGVWVAHGEGRFTFRNEEVVTSLEKSRCLAIKYVDDDGRPTMAYPLNPNGSPYGVAGVCSEDGRHLAMMPHPERCTQLWQWPWMPADWRNKYTISPWLRIFENAFTWCVQNAS